MKRRTRWFAGKAIPSPVASPSFKSPAVAVNWACSASVVAFAIATGTRMVSPEVTSSGSFGSK